MLVKYKGRTYKAKKFASKKGWYSIAAKKRYRAPTRSRKARRTGYKKKGGSRKLQISRMRTKNPFGDLLNAKFSFYGSSLLSGGNIAGTPYATGVILYNNLNTIVTQMKAATNSPNFGLGAGNAIPPPGFLTWLNQFQTYRVNGACLEITADNLGLAGTQTAPDPIDLTPYIAVSAEGVPASGGPSSATNYAYWAYPQVRNQRWAKFKVLGQPGSSKSQKRIKIFVSNAQLYPDYVQRQALFAGTITPSTSGAPAPVITNPTYSNSIGFCITTLTGNTNPTAAQVMVAYKLTLYMQGWDKMPSSLLV